MSNPLSKLLLGALVVMALLLGGVLLQNRDQQVEADLIPAAEASGGLDSSRGFSRATGPQPLNFPEDHGPHPDYQTEWWYYTGNLQSAGGRRFGYQLTFFRRALQLPAERQARASDWGTEQVYMAHFTLTDIAGGRFQAYERLARGAAGLSGARADPYQVWLEDWRVEAAGPDLYSLSAAQGDIAIELELADLKGPILQGDQGYSQKGPEAGNASYYYSLTRLASRGQIRIGDQYYPVEGLSWMDHEYSTSALSEGQVGWDWFSLQLDDGSEIMVFQIRREDGQIDPFSSGTFVAPDGSKVSLERDDFEIQVKDTWRSPRSSAEYPSRWVVTIPSLDVNLEVEPHLADQELDVSYAYWEGAVRVAGSRRGAAVSGNGYVELTGYAGSMSGEF